MGEASCLRICVLASAIVAVCLWKCDDVKAFTVWGYEKTSQRLVGDMTSERPKLSAIKAQLFHRDYMQPTSADFTSGQRAVQDARLSKLRAQHLSAKAIDIPGAAIPEGQPGPSVPETQRTFEGDLSTAPYEYVMKISLGTPAQQFLVVLDTGSDLTWVQSNPCPGCLQQASGIFEPLRSSTYSTLKCSSQPCTQFLSQYGYSTVFCNANCQYIYRYVDQSNSTGDFSTDIINLQNTNGEISQIPNFAFGCAHSTYSQSGLYFGSNGVLGLGQGLISFPSQLGSLYGDQFSYCLVNRQLGFSQSSTIVFGATEVTGHQFTPIISNSQNHIFYYVGLEGISVDGERLDIPQSTFAISSSGQGGTIFDSGATYTVLNPQAFDALSLKLNKVKYKRIPGPYSWLNICWDVKGLSDFSAPTITFNFANANLELPLFNAYILVSDTPSPGDLALCVAMNRGSEGVITTIGNTQQRDFHFLYDRQNRRIGFVRQNCSNQP